jgi:hypothetical protein
MAIWLFSKTHKVMLAKGKSRGIANAWAVGAVLALSLPWTWDAIPTLIAFEYYAHKDAGLTVFKTLEQWKAENPGVAETLEPYGKDYNDRRTKANELANNRVRRLMNPRFAFDEQLLNPILSIHIAYREIVDIKTGQVMVRLVGVGSGNSGGFASGGDGWWKFWNLHSSSTPEQLSSYSKLQSDFHFLGNK